MIFRKKADVIKSHYELYRDCSELPLYNWIKLAITGSHKWLIKSGDTDDDLSDSYAAIFTEYTSLVKDIRTVQELKLNISINTLANRIDHINICINHLRIEREERLISILQNELGFYRLSYTDLQKDLDLTETLTRSDIVKLEQKKQHYAKMIVETDSGTNNDESAFYEQISVVEKWKGYAINPHTVSLLQYIVYLNQLKTEIKNNPAINS